MRDHIIPESKCPYCEHKMDRSLNAEVGQDCKPSPGSISICLRCNKIAIFTEGLQQRKPTPEELEAALKLPAVTLAQMAIAHATWNAPWKKDK